MKLMIPYLSAPLYIEEDSFNALIIENQRLFREIIDDIREQINGFSGDIVFSIDDTPKTMLGNAELITDFFEIDINKKSLINKIQSIMEKTAVDEQHYFETRNLLSNIEQYIQKIAFECTCDVECNKLSISNVLKMAGLHFVEEYKNQLEKLIDYMSLIREYENEKLFILVNMRSWFSDDEMDLFIRTALVHKYRLLLVDNKEYSRLSSEKRIIIDQDLCEIS